MRRACMMLVATGLAVAVALPGFSQELTAPKIPRRVYFPPAAIAQGVTNPALKAVPDYLYTEISAQQPIVRVDSASAANSVVEVSVTQPGPSIVVRLVTKGVEVLTVSGTASTGTEITRLVRKAASELTPHLGMVEPVVERTNEQGKPTGNQALIQKVQLADSFARPIELSLEGPSLLRGSSATGSGIPQIGLDPVPLIVHVAYFFSRSIGIDASLFSYYGTRIGFGRPQTSTTGPYTRSLLLLPGIGVKYRSLGRLFATFSVGAYAGYGYVTNLLSQPVGTVTQSGFQLFLNAGASKSIFYTLLRFASDFGYNLSPRLALHVGVALNLDPFGLFGTNPFGYPTDDSSFFLQYLTLGVSYRP